MNERKKPGEINQSDAEIAFASQEVPSDDNIIVCKRSNDTYHYYYYRKEI